MEEVRLVDYNPLWPAMYAEEIARVCAALPAEMIVECAHFGSTAIPGMVAKPVIDMLVSVRSLDEAKAVAPPLLAPLGYSYWADNPKKDRMFLVRGLPPAPSRTHHLHITAPGGELWRRLKFRDYLRADAEEAARYVALKRELAERFRMDREAYTEAKSAYVLGVLAKAQAA
jgi:GrpB-like predicted nucleotidyltransferase (UPF0157 family)